MAIIRVEKDKNNPYVQINKNVLNDPRISFKAKGLMAYLLSLPDDWEIYESEVVNHSRDGKDSLKSAIKELIETGYIERTRIRDEKGRLGAYEYTVREVSIQDGKTYVGKTYVGKSAPTNNNTTNNNNTNINTSSKDEEEAVRSEIFKEIVDRYNEIEELPSVVKLTDKRKKTLNARLKDFSKEQILEVLNIVNRNDFLLGKTGKWKCDFDWIMNPNNFVKILEGKYGETNNKKNGNANKTNHNALEEVFVSIDDIDY